MAKLSSADFIAKLKASHALQPERMAAYYDCIHKGLAQNAADKLFVDAWVREDSHAFARQLLEAAAVFEAESFSPDWPDITYHLRHTMMERALSERGMKAYVPTYTGKDTPCEVRWYLWQQDAAEPKPVVKPVISDEVLKGDVYDLFRAVREHAAYVYNIGIPEGQDKPRWMERRDRLAAIADANLEAMQEAFISNYEMRSLMGVDAGTVISMVLEPSKLPEDVKPYEQKAYAKAMAAALGPAFTGDWVVDGMPYAVEMVIFSVDIANA